MNGKLLSLVCFAASLTPVHAQQLYEGYEDFYLSRANRLFGESMPQDKVTGYSVQGEEGLAIETALQWRGARANLLLSSRYFSLHGRKGLLRTYRFKDANQFPTETAAGDDSYSLAAEIYVTDNNELNALCIEGPRNGCGEAGSRYKDVYLLLSPKKVGRREEFLHLPALLASCRAVQFVGGSVIFPGNSYVYDSTHMRRIGLTMSLHSIHAGVYQPSNGPVSLRFAQPEDPFRFYVDQPGERGATGR